MNASMVWMPQKTPVLSPQAVILSGGGGRRRRSRRIWRSEHVRFSNYRSSDPSLAALTQDDNLSAGLACDSSTSKESNHTVTDEYRSVDQEDDGQDAVGPEVALSSEYPARARHHDGQHGL